MCHDGDVPLHKGRTHIAKKSCLSCTTVPVIGARTPWSLHFFLRRRRKKRSKEGRAPPRSLRPKDLGPLPKKAKLASLKQSPFPGGIGSKTFPCGSASVPTGGCPEPAFFVSRIFSNAHPLWFRISAWGADLHHDLNDFEAVGTSIHRGAHQTRQAERVLPFGGCLRLFRPRGVLLFSSLYTAEMVFSFFYFL